MAQILCNCVPWCPLGQARTGAFAAFAVSPKIVHLLLHLYSIRNIHATTVFDKVRAWGSCGSLPIDRSVVGECTKE